MTSYRIQLIYLHENDALRAVDFDGTLEELAEMMPGLKKAEKEVLADIQIVHQYPPATSK